MITSQKLFDRLVIIVKCHFSIKRLSSDYWDWCSGVLHISSGQHHYLFFEPRALSRFSDFPECGDSWLHFYSYTNFFVTPEFLVKGVVWDPLCFICSACLSAFFPQIFTGNFLWRMNLLLIPWQEEATKFSLYYMLLAEKLGVTTELFLFKQKGRIILVS